jgi:hypothetical protein
VSIGTGATATQALDVAGQFKLANTQEGINRVLVSDATGLSTWQLPSKGNLVFTNQIVPYVLGPLAQNVVTPVEPPATVLGFSTSDFAMPSPARLEYLGAGPRVFTACFAFSVSTTTGFIGTNYDYTFTFAINAVSQTQLAMRWRGEDRPAEYWPMCFTSDVELTTNDVLSVFVVNNDPQSRTLRFPTFQLCAW